MKRCNSKNTKANDPNYECNPSTGRWIKKKTVKSSKKKCNPEHPKAALPDHRCNSDTGRWKKITVEKVKRVKKVAETKRPKSKYTYNASVVRKIPRELDLEDFVKQFELKGGFTSKRLVKKNKGELLVYFDPPNGPIPMGAKCSFDLCKKENGANHKKSCSTPLYKYLVFSDKGLDMYSEKIESFLKSKNVRESFIDDVLNDEQPFSFSNIVPNKNKEEMSVENMVSLEYNGTKIRVSSDSSIHILYGPGSMDPLKIYKKIFPSGPDVILKKTMLRFTFDLVSGKKIKMGVLNRYLSVDPNITKYKYSDTLKRISFSYVSPQQTNTFMINSTGKVQMILTKPKNTVMDTSFPKKFLTDLVSDIPDLYIRVYVGK